MSDNDKAFRSIAVAGGGIVGLSAAIAFARALPRTKMTLIDLPSDPAALADRMPAAQVTVGRFHPVIGLDETDLVRSGIAQHHLGCIFEDWSATGDAWVHAFGPHGKPVGAVQFDQLWVRARKAGSALPYHRYSAAAVLAEARKFVHPSGEPNFEYGLRLDPESYCNRLVAQAESSGIEILVAKLGAIERRDDGGVAAMLLAGGARVEADLFIDASGPSARLLSEVEDSFESWEEFLPADRLLITIVEDGHPPSPSARARAVDIGWVGEWPLPGRTMKTLAFTDASIDEARSLVGDPYAKPVAIMRGRRMRPWARNVLALGDAATAVDPLEGMNLDLAQRAILLALELLPGRDCHPLVLREYNRRSELVTTRVRDFLALHYLRSGRRKGTFWAEIESRALPDSLARTLDQYGTRGRLPFHEEESVTRDSWAAVLLGMGVTPAAVDPLADGVDFDASNAAMQRLADELRQRVERLPPYGDYLGRMTNAGR